MIDLVSFFEIQCEPGRLDLDAFAVHIASPSGMFKEESITLLANILVVDLCIRGLWSIRIVAEQMRIICD